MLRGAGRDLLGDDVFVAERQQPADFVEVGAVFNLDDDGAEGREAGVDEEPEGVPEVADDGDRNGLAPLINRVLIVLAHPPRQNHPRLRRHPRHYGGRLLLVLLLDKSAETHPVVRFLPRVVPGVYSAHDPSRVSRSEPSRHRHGPGRAQTNHSRKNIRKRMRSKSTLVSLPFHFSFSAPPRQRAAPAIDMSEAQSAGVSLRRDPRLVQVLDVHWAKNIMLSSQLTSKECVIPDPHLLPPSSRKEA
ncbi:hypothetical protein BDK51DRAFT_48455 [Blyttiomyces helicus]|uniref:Uncharacterized protein n=1 Tax=Blyttiomyces helicus TaxID=388810 RepID=A0A4P9W039_9FUNG|nr:hypothetical protein BDK51DRAFT_48455 [Blyttiomyces helicus]|eukprot:RKO84992.1 hypothetical protein BDK51DRAFT_48455 [Blyttiomyces helicus]